MRHLLLLLQSTRDGAAVVLYGHTRGRGPVVTIADVSFRWTGWLHLLCLHSRSTAALPLALLTPPATLRCCCARCGAAVCVQRRHDQGILAQPLPHVCGQPPQRGTEGGDESAGARDYLSLLRCGSNVKAHRHATVAACAAPARLISHELSEIHQAGTHYPLGEARQAIVETQTPKRGGKCFLEG